MPRCFIWLKSWFLQFFIIKLAEVLQLDTRMLENNWHFSPGIQKENVDIKPKLKAEGIESSIFSLKLVWLKSSKIRTPIYVVYLEWFIFLYTSFLNQLFFFFYKHMWELRISQTNLLWINSGIERNCKCLMDSALLLFSVWAVLSLPSSLSNLHQCFKTETTLISFQYILPSWIKVTDLLQWSLVGAGSKLILGTVRQILPPVRPYGLLCE